MKKLVAFIIFFAIYSASIAQSLSKINNTTAENNQVLTDNTIVVAYNGTTATVTVADNIAQQVTQIVSGAHVSITSNNTSTEITYILNGSSTDGEFFLNSAYNCTIILNGLTLTNTTPNFCSAAIKIQNSNRTNINVASGTTNTITDASSGSDKGCLLVKSEAIFNGNGTLNIIGNLKHGIKTDEYVVINDATINITSAAGDGISCNQYLLVESGTINISGTDDDGIQCDIDGNASTGSTNNHENEDSGNIYICGGNININCPATAAKGIKSEGNIYISDNANISITTTGNGSWDEDDLETNAACGISADGDIDISGGNISLTATGAGGKGIKCDGFLMVSDGYISISTSGNIYYNNGTTENNNYTGNTDNIDNDLYSSPKGIRVGVKTENGNSYTYSGGIVISGGIIKVTTSGVNGEGIESKNSLEISGGEIFVNAYDDGINAGQDINITNGYIYSRSTNNDGIDANGNLYINGGLVYAIGGNAPEVAIDANSEEGKHLYLNGGTIISIGGLEQGSFLSQTCYQTAIVNSNTWYSITYNNNTIAFFTPSINTSGPGGGPGGWPGSNSSSLIISTPSTPTLYSDVTPIGGTAIFEENCFLNTSVSGGNFVNISIYGNSGGGNSIQNVNAENITIKTKNGNIVVEGCDNCDVKVFDIKGRLVGKSGLASGIYIVKINNHQAYKVIVSR